jgi:hypothetical protein
MSLAIPSISSEIDRWFAELVIACNSTPEQQNVYIQSKIYEFLIIIAIARDFLAISATSAPSEQVFSQAGNLILKKRTQIASDMVRYVLCLRSWGLLPEAEDEEDILIGLNREILEVEPPAVAGLERAGNMLVIN